MDRTDFDVPVKPKNHPLIESIAVDLPAPSLNDNTADLDRLARTLGQLGRSPVQIAPGKMNNLVRKIRGNDLCFRAVVGYTSTHWEVLDVVARSPDSAVFGFALDLGTSRLVFQLIDIARKKVIREVSEKNPQAVWGFFSETSRMTFLRAMSMSWKTRREVPRSRANPKTAESGDRATTSRTSQCVLVYPTTARKHRSFPRIFLTKLFILPGAI